MPLGDAIRRARLRRGWTQAQLAAEIGRSQPYVSQIERGRGGSPRDIERIRELLDLEPEPAAPERQLVAELEWDGPPQSVRSGWVMKTWQRPRPSGDFVLFRSHDSGDLTVVAVDVVGHGPRAAPIAIYLQGWVRGTCPASKALRADDLAERLHQELGDTGLAANYYVGVFRLIDAKRHLVSYEGTGQGYPPPLLIIAGSTAPSAPAPGSPASPPVRHDSLVPPWRLVIASDGLLRRLGAGHESEGKRSLLRWQTGTRREAFPARFLETEQRVTDDESFALLSWQRWDGTTRFDIENATERHRAYDLVKEAAAELDAAVAERIGHVLVEAFSNCARHAYPEGYGSVIVRWRREGDRFRVEVEDSGRGGAVEEGSGFATMRRWASVDYWKSGVNGLTVSLSTNVEGEDG